MNGSTSTLRLTTLCFLLKRAPETSTTHAPGSATSICLARKKRGFGFSKWNGAGGKVELGESISAAAVRETAEEIGVTPTSLSHVGVLEFVYQANPSWNNRCSIFTAETWSGGDPTESEEMAPAWFTPAEIPYDNMWADDAVWLPTVLASRNGKVWYRFVFDMENKLNESIVLKPDYHLTDSPVDDVNGHSVHAPLHPVELLTAKTSPESSLSDATSSSTGTTVQSGAPVEATS